MEAVDAGFRAFFFLAILFNSSAASSDRGYCAKLSRTYYLYRDPDLRLDPINTGGERDGFLAWDSTSATATTTHTIGANGDFLGGTEMPLTGPSYCPPSIGTIHVAEINGDGRDDLICRKTPGGALSVRYYGSSGYEPEESIASGFTCTDGIYFGDFDGNGADDFLCVNGPRDSYTMYFNLAGNRKIRTMLQSSSVNPYALRNTIGDYQFRQLGYDLRYQDNPHNVPKYRSGSLPAMTTLTGTLPCSADTSDSILIADVNGDKASDVVCHDDSSNAISFTLSSGKVSSAVLDNAPVLQLAGGSSCVHSTSSLLATDVDGDGDKDIACIVRNARRTHRSFPVAYADSGNLQAFSTILNDCDLFCGHGSGVTTRFSVGDFNGDGYDDLLCRLDRGTRMRTEILFSEEPPLV